MNNKDFFDNLDLRYPEIVECLERNGTKFYVPILMGLIENAGGQPKDITENNSSNTSKIRNKNNNLGISNITKTNYITLTVPENLWYSNYNITGIKYEKGDRFIVVFVGGDLSKIRIVGRY